MRLPPVLVARKRKRIAYKKVSKPTLRETRKGRRKVSYKHKTAKKELERRVLALIKKLRKYSSYKLPEEKRYKLANELILAIWDPKTFNGLVKRLVTEGEVELLEYLKDLAAGVNFRRFFRVEEEVAGAEIVALRRKHGKELLQSILRKCEKYKNKKLRKAVFLDFLLQEGPAKYTATQLELFYLSLIHI